MLNVWDGHTRAYRLYAIIGDCVHLLDTTMHGITSRTSFSICSLLQTCNPMTCTSCALVVWWWCKRERRRWYLFCFINWPLRHTFFQIILQPSWIPWEGLAERKYQVCCEGSVRLPTCGSSTWNQWKQVARRRTSLWQTPFSLRNSIRPANLFTQKSPKMENLCKQIWAQRIISAAAVHLFFGFYWYRKSLRFLNDYLHSTLI